MPETLSKEPRKMARDQSFTPQSPWLDLVNSEFWDGFGGRTDSLEDDRWRTGFLERWGLPTALQPSRSALKKLRELRSLLRRMTGGLGSGRSLSEKERRSVNLFLAAPAYRQLVGSGKRLSVEERPLKNDWAWVRARIAESFVDDGLERPERIKVCCNAQCRWAFVDATRGNVRRWCKDSRCGNRDRVRRARERARRRI